MSKENGGGSNVDPIVQAIRELGRDLGARIDKTNERLEATNERIDGLATATVEGFSQVRDEVAGVSRRVDGLGVRLDAVVVNTGEHWRDLARRVTALEARRD